MKGKPRTAVERRFHDLLCSVVGCAACRFGHSVVTHHVSVHHMRGRTRPGVQFFVLPLCAGHHQKGTGASWMKSVHEDKAEFVTRYGTQEHLLRLCVMFVLARGHNVPDAALCAAGIDPQVAAAALAMRQEGEGGAS
ncbi:recombinase [Achromobacter deleyi]|uniref:Recombinase n=1 Tax=Achromobacter deleyi TaxID=1353891 RepID=A0A7T4E1M0_9BURK|nr:Ref family recombination enhancement nuclease [Achromobacter deleyi]QQB32810.1 recombinase [Achromobacter deleyi]